jgi:hypothetical protein
MIWSRMKGSSDGSSLRDTRERYVARRCPQDLGLVHEPHYNEQGEQIEVIEIRPDGRRIKVKF